MLTGKVPKPWWRIAVFKTQEEMEAWIRRYGDKAEWGYVFINNKYGIEHRRKVAPCGRMDSGSPDRRLPRERKNKQGGDTDSDHD